MKVGPVPALIRVARPYAWALPVLTTLGILASLAEGVGIGLMIPALDIVLGSAAAGSDAGPFGSLVEGVADRLPEERALPVLGGAILLLIALKTSILIIEALVSSRVVSWITRELRVGLCRQLLEVGMAFHARADQGRLVNVMDTQTWRASEALRSLATLVGSACTVLVFCILLVLLSWQMALLAFATAVPVAFLVRVLSKRAQAYGSVLVYSHSTMVGRMLEILTAMRTIRLFGQEKAEVDRFTRAADSVRFAHIRADTLVAILPALVEMFYLPVFVVVTVYAVQTGTGIALTLAFLLLLYRLQSPLKRLDTSRVAIASYAEGITEIERILARSDKPYIGSGDRVPGPARPELRFDRVGFRYEDESEPALRDLSFTVAAGETCAIVGSSGAGKSTIINLVCRFFDPSQGVIAVDGVDLKELDLSKWRGRIAFAGQDAEILSGTIAENIAYGVRDPSPEAIRVAAAVACATEFIEALPQGFDTPVGTRGLTLSGGQRQRISLARAVFRRPDLLIFDEATNAVDRRTEDAIMATAIEHLDPKPTFLIIAHRPTVARLADHVVVLEGGCIVADGTPDALDAPGGPLRRLFGSDTREESTVASAGR